MVTLSSPCFTSVHGTRRSQPAKARCTSVANYARSAFNRISWGISEKISFAAPPCHNFLQIARIIQTSLRNGGRHPEQQRTYILLLLTTESRMRVLFTVLIVAISAAAQTSTPPQPATLSAASPVAKPLVVPAGTKVPVSLKHAINTKSARDGDSVYAETTFPVVQDNRVLIPAGTYVQGKISNVKRGGRIKGRAEILIHFTTLIYPSGYTVLLPGSVENVPGADKTSRKTRKAPSGRIARQAKKWVRLQALPVPERLSAA